MVLDRQALESKLLQEMLAHPELDLEIWSDEQLQQSIGETLQQHPSRDVWIFAYGSLIWNPLFEYSDRCTVTIDGWHRQFCMLAPVGRGTIENPGLVLGLEPKQGVPCEGIAYHLPKDNNLEFELLLLWRREMVVGSYIPTWITAQTGDWTPSTDAPGGANPLGLRDRKIKVLAFTVNPQHSVYVNWSKDRIVESLASAKGDLGSSAEYLDNTVQGLLKAGIEDEDLIELNNLVKNRQQD